jgi:hypothetical protein
MMKASNKFLVYCNQNRSHGSPDRRRMRDHKEVEEVRVTVIGCGFSGLGMTIKLLKVGKRAK